MYGELCKMKNVTDAHEVAGHTHPVTDGAAIRVAFQHAPSIGYRFAFWLQDVVDDDGEPKSIVSSRVCSSVEVEPGVYEFSTRNTMYHLTIKELQ